MWLACEASQEQRVSPVSDAEVSVWTQYVQDGSQSCGQFGQRAGNTANKDITSNMSAPLTHMCRKQGAQSSQNVVQGRHAQSAIERKAA